MTDTTTLLRAALDALDEGDLPRAELIDAIRAHLAQPQPKPVEFLMYGARFKLNFNGKGNCTTFQNLVHDLQGRWVALVAAENDKHLATAQPAPVPPAVWTPEEIAAAKERAKESAPWLLQNAPAQPAKFSRRGGTLTTPQQRRTTRMMKHGPNSAKSTA